MIARRALLLTGLLLLSTTVQGLHVDVVEANGRAVEPDLNITAVEVVGPSFADGVAPVVAAPGSQTVRITVTNDGLAQATGTVSLRVDDGGGSWALESFVSVNLAPGESAQPLLSWNAGAGLGQSLRGDSTVTGDSNPANDQMDVAVDVTDLVDGALVSDDLPVDGTRLARTSHTFDVMVRNVGTAEVEATAAIRLTSQVDGSVSTIPAPAVTLPAGSQAAPAQTQTIGVVVDASSLFGAYTMEAIVGFTSSAPVGTDADAGAARTVTFSPYRGQVQPPADRAVEPGDSTLLTFIVHNIGEMPDRWNITVNTPMGWADVGAVLANTSIVNGSDTTTVVVPVNVPASADRSEADVITLRLESVAEGYIMQASTAVMAGDRLAGMLIHGGAVEPIIPGTPHTITYTLRNTGTAPASYALTAGLVQNAPGWTIHLPVANTDLMTVGEERLISIVVTPPALTHPLDPAAKLTEGNQLHLWTRVLADQGGQPSDDQTTLEVQPAVMVDLSPATDAVVLTPEEVLAGQVQVFVDVSLQLRHNLLGNLSATVDVDFSVDPLEVTPATPGVGAREGERWNASLNPDNLTLTLGESAPLVLTALGPVDDLPLAATLGLPMRATLSLGGSLSGVFAPDAVRTVEVIVPAIVDAAWTPAADVNATPEETAYADVTFSNAGNIRADFATTVSAPEGWTASIAAANFTGVPAPVDDWPDEDGDESRVVNLSVVAPQGTRADTVYLVTLSVFDDAGNLLDEVDVRFRIAEVINASLTPDPAVAVIPVGGSATIALEANNTGNSAQIFRLEVVESLDRIDLTLLTPENITIEPGAVSIVRIEVLAGANARADVNHSAEVALFHGADELARITVYVEVLPSRSLTFGHDSLVEVIPGASVSVPVEVTNWGNLDEDLTYVAQVGGGWDITVAPVNMSILGEGVETLNLSLNITVPALDAGEGLSGGDTHLVTLNALNRADGELVGGTEFTLEVQPVFILEAAAWPDLVEMLPGTTRTVSVPLSNVGNEDVTLNLTCDMTPDVRWDLANCDGRQIQLDSGESMDLAFQVTASASDHYHNEQGYLDIQFTPQGDIAGEAMLESTFRIVRIESTTTRTLEPTQSTHDITLDWAHVQSVGQTADMRDIAYTLSLDNMSRQVDASLYGGDLDWDFVWVIDGDTYPVENLTTLPEASPWEVDTLTLRVTIPDAAVIPPGDGWNLRLELAHPEESLPRLFNVEVGVDAWADPGIVAVEFDQVDSLMEGETGRLVVQVDNHGNAIMPTTAEVEVECADGVRITDTKVQTVPALPGRGTMRMSWAVQAESLEWWVPRADFTCTATLNLPDIAGNQPADDQVSADQTVDSYAPPIWAAAALTLLLVGLTVGLTRRGDEDERMLLFAAYTGTAAMGMATMLRLDWRLNLVLGVFALVWVARIAWWMGYEFQALHADRRRALLGRNAMLEDHAGEVDNTHKQLNIMLSLAFLGYVVPTVVAPTSGIALTFANFASIVVLLVAGPVLARLVLDRAERTWRLLHEDLALLERTAEKVRRRLGDPSGALRRITIGQRHGDLHHVEVERDV